MTFLNHGLFNAKDIFVEEQKRYSLTHSWRDKGVYTKERKKERKKEDIKRKRKREKESKKEKRKFKKERQKERK